jgi:ATP-dependent Clp protease adaptor protein ClpS
MTTDTIIEEKTVNKKKILEPKKYKVIVFNDDFTPVDFVIEMFIAIFKKNQHEATSLTLKIHNEGSAIAGVYSYEIAEQKIIDAVNFARMNGFPLMLKAEQE